MICGSLSSTNPSQCCRWCHRSLEMLVWWLGRHHCNQSIISVAFGISSSPQIGCISLYRQNIVVQSIKRCHRRWNCCNCHQSIADFNHWDRSYCQNHRNRRSWHSIHCRNQAETERSLRHSHPILIFVKDVLAEYFAVVFIVNNFIDCRCCRIFQRPLVMSHDLYHHSHHCKTCPSTNWHDGVGFALVSP